MKIYTRHGQSRAVPDFRGHTLTEVQKMCKKHRLRYQIADSVYLANRPKGTVVEQNPLPGSRVKKRRNVFLILNAVNPELVEVPNVIGVSFRQAKALLESNGLIIGKLEYIRDIAVNNVLNQKYMGTRIIPGSQIPRFSRIDLILGNGFGNQKTYTPNLAGKRIDGAHQLLIDSYCNLGTILYDNTINSKDDSLKAFVWKQFPEFDDNKTVKLGMYVDLWFTLDIEKISHGDSTSFSTE
ncbi:PASTA domain-containing protein [Bacteroidota bacterium]